MKIIVLTSSRADYGIYLPLLKKIVRDKFFDLGIVVFGTHLSKEHGYTIDAIKKDGFIPAYEFITLPKGDSAPDIAESIGATSIQFSSLWNSIKDTTDIIFCLGDRYEMFAAVIATIPYNLTVAHIHGGEATLGANDNIYRHCITHISKYHFASTENHANRVIELKGSTENVYNVGSLSLENLKEIKLLSKDEFLKMFGIPIDHPVLVTFHPETVGYEKNEIYVKELIKALEKIDKQIIITMPNADTMGNVIRTELSSFANQKQNVFTIESLGTQGYFSCLNLCDYVLGNSSSGIIEAASFGKYVINIGDRQKGRDSGANVLHSDIEAWRILECCQKIKTLPLLDKKNIYEGGDVANKIINVLKKIG